MKIKWEIIEPSVITRWVITILMIAGLYLFGNKFWLTFALIYCSIFCEIYWYLWRAK